MEDVLTYPSDDEQFDVLISDVKPEDLPGRVSQALGVPYLSGMQVRANAVEGVIVNTKGSKLRALVTLPVSARGQSVATHFIFCTGAPHSYVALSVLKALGVPEVSFGAEVVRLNGVKANLGVSDTFKVSSKDGEELCNFVGLNVLGMDYLDRAAIKLEIDMPANRVVFTSTQFPAAARQGPATPKRSLCFG